jgi:hypothetical protein
MRMGLRIHRCIHDSYSTSIRTQLGGYNIGGHYSGLSQIIKVITQMGTQSCGMCRGIIEQFKTVRPPQTWGEVIHGRNTITEAFSMALPGIDEMVSVYREGVDPTDFPPPHASAAIESQQVLKRMRGQPLLAAQSSEQGTKGGKVMPTTTWSSIIGRRFSPVVYVRPKKEQERE